MSSIGDFNKTTDSDRPEVVITSESTGDRAEVTDQNRLKTDTIFQPNVFPSFDVSNLYYEDMNAANGGIARDTTLPSSFTTLYSYSGAGSLIGFLINFNRDDDIYIRLIVDGSYPFFGTAGIFIGDLSENDIYDIKDLDPQPALGLRLHDNCLTVELKYLIRYSSSVLIQARSTSNRKFEAGFVSLIKES